MQVITDISYLPDHGERGRLDLYLPDRAPNSPIVMVIHGGGLRALNKERMAGVSALIAEQGWAAVTPNYRLLPDHPFPAALEDMLAAYEWIHNTDREDISALDRTHMALLGASAGGFLVLAAGFILGRRKVRSIVSVAGPSQRTYGTPPPESQHDPRLFTPPVDLIGPDAPPLLATHSRNDEVVDPQESTAVVETMQAAGRPAELYRYDGPGIQHGIWRNDQPPLRFYEHLEATITAFLRKTL